MKPRKNRASKTRKDAAYETGRPSRRSLLAGSMLLGTAALLPKWLAGCGPLPNGLTAVAGTSRERRTLHFDFSHLEAGVTYTFNAPHSASHRKQLRPHTGKTRTYFRRESALLRQIPDEHLTHYLVDVDLPGATLQHCWITSVGANGVPAFVSSHLHVPMAAYAALATSKARSAGQPVAMLDAKTHPKLQHLKISQTAQATAATLGALNSIHTPVDAATAVVFHHPEIMNLDPVEAAQVLDVIDSLQGVGTSCTGDNVGVLTALACAIAAQGIDPDTGWMRQIAALDSDGQPVLDANGNPIYESQISDATTNAADPVIKEVLKRLYASAGLRGSRLSDTSGLSSVGGDGGSATAKSRRHTSSATPGFQVSLSHPTGPFGSRVHGLIFRDFSVTNGDTRSVALQVENIYLRYCDAYVQFLQADRVTPIANADGTPMKPRHLAVIPTDQAIMGIPLLDQDTLEKTTLAFDIPEEASFANILFGTLGASGPAVGGRNIGWSPGDVNHSAMAWTLVVNVGIPSLLLAMGVGMEDSELLDSISNDPEIMAAIAAIVVPLFIAGEATRGALSGSARGPIVDTANILIALCIKRIPALTAKLLEYAGEEELIDAVPFVGWAARALGIAGGVAQLAETTGEVLSSPLVFDNTVCFAMDTTVTIQHDPRDFEFPASAKVWVLRATYDGTVVREACGTLPTTRTDPIVAKLSGVPVGGRVQYDVWFLSADNWIVGQGGSGHWKATGELDETGQPVERWIAESLRNFPEDVASVIVTIREQLVPLTASTVYSHREKLAFSKGVRTWQSAAAPLQTVANLDSSRKDALHALGVITVHQAAASVGYCWRTGQPEVSGCASDNSSATSLQVLQNLSLTQFPEQALKSPDCGRINQPAIAYSVNAALGAAARNFFVDPTYGPYVQDDRTTVQYRYFVRSVSLDSLADRTPFGAAAGQSWGYFTLPSDGVAAHPTGHVISVNTANSKLEILHLPGAPTADKNAPCATMLSGAGALPGLLSGPTAVAVAPNGAVLVLDAGNNRVQAFDAYGSVNNVYLDDAGTARNFFPLQSTNATRYLDLAVEAAVGYVFVLYYINSGTQPGDYILDIYTRDGAWLTRTGGMNVARIALDYWRNIYTLNYEAITGPTGRVEPSISQWIPSTPAGHDPNALAALSACP